MTWNGSGTFSRTYGSSGWTNDKNAGTKILASRHDTNDDDLSDGINNCLAKDGQNAATGNLPMGGFKHTGVASATARDQYASAGQVADGGLIYLTGVAGTNTITASASPAITAYTAGQAFRFIGAGTTTATAVTLNINGLGAKNVTRPGWTTLVPGDIRLSTLVEVVYDGSGFQLMSNYSYAGVRTSLATGIDTTSGSTVNLVASGLATTPYSTLYIHINGVSLSGTDDVLLQIGDDSGFVTSGYTSRGSIVTTAAASSFSSAGFLIQSGAAAAALYGLLILSRRPALSLPGGDQWSITGALSLTSTGGTVQVTGQGTLNSATPAKVLDRLRLTVTGANTFDAGSVDVYGDL